MVAAVALTNLFSLGMRVNIKVEVGCGNDIMVTCKIKGCIGWVFDVGVAIGT